MLQLQLTERVQELFDEAKSLKPESPIIFVEMTDQEMLVLSAGAAAITDNAGNETIHIDSSRVDEHLLAHEIMHIILHRNKWPQMYALIPNDKEARYVADTIDNLTDHAIFYPRLLSMGIDVKPYREETVRKIEYYPTEEQTKLDIIIKLAFNVAEPLTWEASYKKRIERALRPTQPEVLSLAKKLGSLISQAQNGKKLTARTSMLQTLDYFNNWYGKKTGQNHSLRSRIGVSPLFTKQQLNLRASELILITGECPQFYGTQLWNVCFINKVDNKVFRTLICSDAYSQNQTFLKLNAKLESSNLGDFLLSQGEIKYAILDS